MKWKIAVSLIVVALLSSSFVGIAEEKGDEIGIEAHLLKVNGSPPPDSEWYYKPDDYDELVEWYQSLEENYSDYMEVFKANEMYNTGTIPRGGGGHYDYYMVRITNESRGFHKPEVLFLGSPHGDETAGTISMYWFVDWLMRYAYHPDYPNPQREWLRWLIDHREIYLAVAHNPDGFTRCRRYDANNWDLNREADYNGPGSPTGGIWGSVNGRTLRRFVDNHTIRVGTDFHGGARMLLYPWGSTHSSVKGTSPISGRSYNYAPPDFYYFDAEALRCGAYMGDFGGDLNPYNIGTIPDTVGYTTKGDIASWGYGADVEKNPVEDPYVKDETFGNYPGAGILWLSPEISDYSHGGKDPPQSMFGNDTTLGYGMEIRRFLLHQIDIAQPYVQWLEAPENNSVHLPGSTLAFKWQVNGSLVVDHTYIQWGTDPDPINNSEYTTTDHDEHAGEYEGGTGWDEADDGETNGVIYEENITLPERGGDYYFVAKAQVDQVYRETLAPDVYGENHSYSRLVKERTNDSYHEEINGTDGLEVIEGQTWWYSPIIHIKAGCINKPKQGFLYIFNREIMPTPFGRTIIIGRITVEPYTSNETTKVEFYVDGKLKATKTEEPFNWKWKHAFFLHQLEVKVYEIDERMATQEITVWIFNP